MLLLLSGCLELGGTTPPSRFYVLTPLPRADPADHGPGLGVGPVRIPGYLDRPQIVTRSAANRIDLAQFDRWAEPLQESVARVLATDLARLLETQRVQRHPWRDAGSLEVRVEVDVLRFDGPPEGPVQLEAQWRIRRGSTLVERTSEISESFEGEGYTAFVAAMSRALERLARDIAVAVPAAP